MDIGSKGHTGKRVLSVCVFLNGKEDFEGGDIYTQISKDGFRLQFSAGQTWIINSFVLQRKEPIVRGTQYMLWYWVERY